MRKITRQEHSKDKPVDNSDIDFSKADKMSDEEIEDGAKSDPDSIPFSEEQIKKVKIRKRHKDSE